MTVQAMKAGAVEFLTEPFRRTGISGRDPPGNQFRICTCSLWRARSSAHERGRYQALTAREREVMAHVVTGMLNKQIAHELGTTEKTIKVQLGSSHAKDGDEVFGLSLSGRLRDWASSAPKS